MSEEDNKKKATSNDFVKKLFAILENGEYDSVVSWSAAGDSFVVKDNNEFTTTILPKHFKHSNFASFVRQLNKYDFHKVKQKNDDKRDTNSQIWEFQHPDFRIHDHAALDNIRRKTIVQKRLNLDNAIIIKDANELSESKNIIVQNTVEKQKIDALHMQVNNAERDISELQRQNTLLKHDLGKLNGKYNTVLESFLTLKTLYDSHVNYVKNLTQALSAQGINVPMEQESAQMQMQHAQHAQHAQHMQHALQAQAQARPVTGGPNGASVATGNQTRQVTHPSPQLPINTSTSPLVSQGVRAGSEPRALSSSNNNTPSASGQHSISAISPGFHVLLVEDDNVCIQLCSKFLMKAGCTVKVVTDGLAAINILEQVRFDLVLMDIVMPNLDGATATSIVRSFDNQTPIIAMTGNIDDIDLVTYLQHGMNDILAKPFTKDDLYLMLSRYLKDRVPLCKSQVGKDSMGQETQADASEPLMKKQRM